MAVAPLVLVALLASTTGLASSRAVNISSVWLLPEEGFPVFYRYFRDRITWFEADAVCQFHHANLVTVDSSEQFDATRAYLKELDVATSVWVGLKRSGARGEFSWTDYKPLENGGYWQEQIPLTDEPVCAALDPAADYRWHPLHCGGPEVASFICQLEVPGWARKEDGCMLTSLPSLTVSYLPEQGAVELISDCGLEGTRRIACKGQANRDEMIKRLSCESAGGTEATTGGTGSSGDDEANEVPTATRHRRDTDVTADMASAGARTPPTTEGMTESSSTDATKHTVPDETKQTPAHTTSAAAVEVADVVVTTQQAPAPQEMSAAEEPIKSSGEVTDDEINESVLPALNQSSQVAKDEDALVAEVPIQIPLNSISRITSEEAGESKQPAERRVVAVQSKPIPPSLRGQSPFVEPTAANKTEGGEPADTVTPKPVEKESHEEFRESKVEIAPKPDKAEKQVNFPPLSVYKVTDDRDPDESSSRVQQATEREEAARPTAEAKFFTRVVAEETATTGTTSTTPAAKADTGNDFFVATDGPLKTEGGPTGSPAPTEPQPTVADMGRPAALTEDREELEPEAPERPNRGRLLVRPQHRSFYPYFLNRVLG